MDEQRHPIQPDPQQLPTEPSGGNDTAAQDHSLAQSTDSSAQDFSAADNQQSELEAARQAVADAIDEHANTPEVAPTTAEDTSGPVPAHPSDSVETFQLPSMMAGPTPPIPSASAPDAPSQNEPEADPPETGAEALPENSQTEENPADIPGIQTFRRRPNPDSPQTSRQPIAPIAAPIAPIAATPQTPRFSSRPASLTPLDNAKPQLSPDDSEGASENAPATYIPNSPVETNPHSAVGTESTPNPELSELPPAETPTAEPEPQVAPEPPAEASNPAPIGQWPTPEAAVAMPAPPEESIAPAVPEISAADTPLPQQSTEPETQNFDTSPWPQPQSTPESSEQSDLTPAFGENAIGLNSPPAPAPEASEATPELQTPTTLAPQAAVGSLDSISAPPTAPSTPPLPPAEAAHTFQLPPQTAQTAPLPPAQPSQTPPPTNASTHNPPVPPAQGGESQNPGTPTKKDWKARFKKVKYKPFVSAVFVGLLVFGVFNSQVILGQIQYLTTPSGGLEAEGAIAAQAPAGEENKIIIPKINVDVPVVYDVTTFDEDEVQKGLERGVVHYGNTALPGEKGNNVIVGHSSNNWWDTGKYKFAFILLDKLQAGDEIILHYEGVRYVYEVSDSFVVPASDVSVLKQTEDPIITLITCTPPGTSWQRLIVQAEQVSPDPDKNSESASPLELPIDTLPSDSSAGFFDFLRNLF